MGALSENWINGFRVIDDGRTSVANYVWDTGTLAWIVQTGGGAGPTTDVNVTNASLAVTQSGAWTVGVNNFPAVYPVNDNGGSLTVDGTVAISGSVAVTGPLTDTQLRATPVPVSASSWPLPTGAATEATLATMLTLAGFQARINTLGQKTMVASTPVVLASDQSAIGVSQSGAWSTGRTWTLARATDNVRAQIFDGTNDVGVKALNVQVVAADFGLITHSVLHGLTTAGGGSYVDVKVTPSGALATSSSLSSANTRTSVAAAIVDTLLLASNTSRLGATIYNDSTAILYLGLGTAAASTTDFTVKMVAGSYYEVPFGYTGQIRGVWASATGSARVGELT